MSLSNVLSQAQAKRLAEFSSEDFDLVIKMASLGLKSDGIHASVVAVAGGKESPVALKQGGPKPLVIQAWSFVKDPGQFSGTYGLSSAKAAELSDLLSSDTESALTQIRAVVAERLAAKGSDKAVKVTLDGAPGDKVARPDAPGKNDGGLKELKKVIQARSGVYGSYKFEAVHGLPNADEAFKVSLGGGLYVMAQSKALAVAAARIVSVKGRHEPLVARFVRFSTNGKKFMAGGSIPSSAFNGVRGARDPLLPAPQVVDPTVTS